MAAPILDRVRRLALPWRMWVVLALTAGLLLGLLLAWGVWPIRWYNTDPADLRIEHQQDYITLVADSLAVNGDTALAHQRLSKLTDEDTSWEQVGALVAQVASQREQSGDMAGALRVRRLAEATGLASAPPAPLPEPRRRVLFAPAPRIALYLLGFGVLILTLALILYVLSRQTWASYSRATAASEPPHAEPQPPAAPAQAPASPPPPVPSPPPAPPEAQQETPVALPTSPTPAQEPQISPWEAEEPVAQAETGEDEEEEQAEIIPLGPVEPPTPPTAVTRRLARHELEPEDLEPLDEEPEPAGAGLTDDDLELVDEEPLPVPPRSAPVEENDVPPDALGIFEAEYLAGSQHFDCAFTIEPTAGEFLGECGIGVSNVLDVPPTPQASAFEVWLFDKGDIRTVSKFLVSPHVYRDEALNAELSVKGDLLIAEPGLTVTLETRNLQVTVTLQECQYAEDRKWPQAYFTYLRAELLVERADELP